MEQDRMLCCEETEVLESAVEQVRRQLPEDEVLYSNRSSCYLRLKDYQHAMEDAETCIRLKPKWERGYYRKGMVFFEQKEYIDAATSFYQGCELAPADAKLSGKVGERVRPHV